MRTLDEFCRAALQSDHGLSNPRAETQRLRDGDMLLWIKGDEGYSCVQMPEGVIRLPCPCYITGTVTSVPLFHQEARLRVAEYIRQLQKTVTDEMPDADEACSDQDGICDCCGTALVPQMDYVDGASIGCCYACF